MSTDNDFQTYLSDLYSLAIRHAPNEGQNHTVIQSMFIYRRSEETPLLPSILTPSMCLVLNGAKRINIGTEVIDYSTGKYLASVIDMPVSGQILEASHESPYIGIWIDFNSDEIAEVALLSKMDLKPKKGSRNPGAFVGKADVNLLDILTRMLNLNGTTADPSFLSNLYKQELIYNLLNGSWGYLYAQQVHLFQQATGLRNTITWIKENYAKPFTIEELAKENNMSASSLHHKFKALTTMGPLQYQKHLRLLEARRLMLNESLDSIEAALEVGYESPSQFNREYKRLFGQPPLRDIKSVHTQLAAKD